MFTIWFGNDWFGQWFGPDDEENGFVFSSLSGSGTLSASLSIVEQTEPPKRKSGRRRVKFEFEEELLVLGVM